MLVGERASTCAGEKWLSFECQQITLKNTSRPKTAFRGFRASKTAASAPLGVTHLPTLTGHFRHDPAVGLMTSDGGTGGRTATSGLHQLPVAFAL